MSALWNSWGCTVQGPSHRKRGIPNQDAWLLRRYRWGEVITVSDGLGSKKDSHIGSRAACFAVSGAARFFAARPEAPLAVLPRLIHALWIVRIAPYAVHDCGATCLFAIRLEDRFLLGRLGDGLVAAITDTDENACIMTDEKIDSFSNMTGCLSEDYHAGEWELRELSATSVSGVMICTDGISEDLLPERRMSFAHKVFANGANITELRRSLMHWPVSHHSDDKTIACIIRGGA